MARGDDLSRPNGAIEELRIDAERRLLGELLWRPHDFERIENLVDARDLVEPVNQWAFCEISRLRRHEKFSIGAMVQSLGNISDRSAAIEYLGTIQKNHIANDPVDVHAKVVRDLANRWRLDELARNAPALYADGDSIEQYQIKIEQAILDSVRVDPMKSGPVDIGEDADLIIAGADPEQEQEPGLPMRLSRLDALMGGFRAGQLIVGAGRPGMGKSIFAIHAAYRAVMEGEAAFMWCGEMSRAEMVARMMALLAKDQLKERLPYSSIMQRRLSAYQFGLLKETREAIKAMPVIVDDRPGRTADQIAYSARQASRIFEARGQRLAIGIADYLQKMGDDPLYKADRWISVGQNSSRIKDAAKDQGIPWLLLAQLNRECEKRPDKRPQISDLRESGGVEADADAILLFLRPEYYLQQEDQRGNDWEARMADAKNVMHIILGKQRNGPPGTASVYCDVATCELKNSSGDEATTSTPELL